MKPLFFKREIELHLGQVRRRIMHELRSGKQDRRRIMHGKRRNHNFIRQLGEIDTQVYTNVWTVLFENNPYAKSWPPMGPTNGVIFEVLDAQEQGWFDIEQEGKKRYG